MPLFRLLNVSQTVNHVLVAGADCINHLIPLVNAIACSLFLSNVVSDDGLKPGDVLS
jgi:hypothetical protein